MFLREIGKAVKIESVTSIVSCAVNGAAWGAGLVMIIMDDFLVFASAFSISAANRCLPHKKHPIMKKTVQQVI